MNRKQLLASLEPEVRKVAGDKLVSIKYEPFRPLYGTNKSVEIKLIRTSNLDWHLNDKVEECVVDNLDIELGLRPEIVYDYSRLNLMLKVGASIELYAYVDARQHARERPNFMQYWERGGKITKDGELIEVQPVTTRVQIVHLTEETITIQAFEEVFVTLLAPWEKFENEGKWIKAGEVTTLPRMKYVDGHIRLIEE